MLGPCAHPPSLGGQRSPSVERAFHLGPLELGGLVESWVTQERPLRSLKPPPTRYSLSPQIWKVDPEIQAGSTRGVLLEGE